MTFEQYKSKYGLTSLTAQQELALQRAEGKTLLLAVPGSGKTTVTIARLGYMIKCLGIPPGQLLCLTYSVASCRDMRERYVSVFGSENAPEFRTINGICAVIIRYYEKVRKTRAFPLMENEGEGAQIIRNLYIKLRESFPTPNEIQELKSKITYARNMLLSEEEIEGLPGAPKGFSEIFRAFREFKKAQRIMDYDDQLEYAYIILRKYPDILEYFSDKFRYISVDEAQDTSKIQHEIIRLLSTKHGNIFMVGDEDQSIYGFRAAFPQALLDFDKTYPDASVLFLEKNFRSTGKIISSAGRVISNNTQRRIKNMTTDNVQGQEIEITKLCDYTAQARFLCRICKDAEDSDRTTAILYRNNDSALPLIDLLSREKVAYKCRENDALFFTSFGVSDMLAMLEFCENTENAELFTRLCPRLGLGLSASAGKNIVSRAARHGSGLLSELCEEVYGNKGRERKAFELCTAIKNLSGKSAYFAITKLYNDTCFGRFLDKRCSDASKLPVLIALAREYGSIRDFLKGMEELCKNVQSHENPSGNCVVLSTVHSSKGLEYDRVIIIDARDGIFPCTSTSEYLTDNEKAALEEERRLFYVAITRAKTELQIIHCEKLFGVPQKKGLFLREVMGEAPKKRAGMLHAVPKPSAKILKKSTSPDLSLYTKGTGIIHVKYGEGEIMSVEKGEATIVFTETGLVNRFKLDVCVKRKFIRLKEN